MISGKMGGPQSELNKSLWKPTNGRFARETSLARNPLKKSPIRPTTGSPQSASRDTPWAVAGAGAPKAFTVGDAATGYVAPAPVAQERPGASWIAEAKWSLNSSNACATACEPAWLASISTETPKHVRR